MHLHLGVQVAHTHLDIKWLRPRFFFEKYQMTHNICTSYGYPRLYYTHIKVSFENTAEVSLDSPSRVDVGTMLVKL